MKRLLFIFVLLTLFLSINPNIALADSSPLPFLPDKSGDIEQSENIGSITSNLGGTLNQYAPQISFIFNAAFAIMFIIGVIKLGYALVTKTGNVLKGATGTLIFVPVFVLSIRLFFILFFTTNGPGVTLLVSELLALLVAIGYLVSIGMVLIGLLLRLFHKFLNHPEYGRWSKRLFQGAVIITLLSAIMPTVLQGI